MDNKTLSLLRPIEKRFHELEFEYLQNAAATYIQAVWRGSLQRRKYSIVKKNKFEEFAIILIQSSVRRILSCYSLLDTRNVKYTSCVMIQSYFRGYLVRKKYEKLLSLKLILLPILLKGSKIIGMSEQINFIKLYKDQNSVSLQMKRLISVQTNLPPGFIKVQNLARMHFIRKQFLNLKNTLEKVYAVAMTKCARMEYLEKVRSAVKIQRWWRLLPKDSIPSLGSGALYYINKKEKNTVSLLSNELKEFGITIYSYVCSDLRRIYLNTWAMVPLTLIKTIRLMQKSSTDLNFTQMRSIDTIKFAIGSTHSLILIQTNQGSCVYSWGWNDKGQLGRKSLYPLKSSDNDFLITNPLEFQSTHNNINNNTNSTNTNSISNTNSHNNTNSSVLEMELYRIYNGLEENVYIVDVVCGNDYSLALSDVGIVYSWGDNTYGQCGQGPRYLKIYQPTAIELNGVTSICSASYHSVVFSNFEFYTFGKTFGYNIFRPVLISKLIPSLVNQTLKVVKCAGTVTLFYTNELDYILSVYNTNFSIYSFKSYRLDSTEYIGNGVVNGQDRVGNRLDTVGSTMGVGNTQDTSDSTLNTLNTVNKWDRIKMYSFMGSIKEVSTNGKIICGIIENGTESSYEVKVYIMGYIKCVPMEKKVGTKNLFVGAFREKFENKTKPISLLNVQTDHGMNCYIPSPAEVILHRIPNQVLCDGEQVIFVTNNAIYGAKLFQIHVQNQDDYEVKDNSTVEIRPGANIRLDPVIYQFMEPFNKKNKLHTSFNSLSHSILYSD
uniref:IQ calmodulin-binding motif/Regulator of chromosome condensation (RCC1) repeat, putative n=1 Tax=Theileria annulata TaxID=5874 RepID=A0A3B0MNF0_THEAN